MGRILSHGYLATGMLPVHIAFPTLASMLLGPSVVVTEEILLTTFQNAIRLYNAETEQIRQGLSVSSDSTRFPQELGEN